MHEGSIREAAPAASRSTPLTIVTAAVAGDDLQSVARFAADAIGRPVAISLPALGAPARWPEGAWGPDVLATLGPVMEAPADGVQVVPVRLGLDVVGVVAALGDPAGAVERQPWLDAAAAAAAVIALRPGRPTDEAVSGFLRSLEERNGTDPDAVLADARRLGGELAGGAVGTCVAGRVERADGTILAPFGDRTRGLVPVASAPVWLRALREAGMTVTASAPRADAAEFGEALCEAELLLELALDPDALFSAQEETYRLLVGVWLRDHAELERLRSTTIASLEVYDADHEAELVATLETFLAHDGSTTETAEAMGLHRHTVGYRLARVHEVSGHSPYASDGRERLSLGLKAYRILGAAARRAARLG